MPNAFREGFAQGNFHYCFDRIDTLAASLDRWRDVDKSGSSF